ncbi:hypothetical protein EXS57_01000 [Candidatus Kaiserbacteria bacterium]|nr:hypothetical protein [Candidatus Kaiserbacteria bacterium]
MKIHNRGFIVPLLLVIITVLLVGGGLYVFTQPKVAQGNTYTVRAGDSVSIPNTSTNDEFLLKVTSVASEAVPIHIQIKSLDGTLREEEIAIKQNETRRFFYCPAFYVTPMALSADAVTLSVKVVHCTL